ncbi:MAG: TRL domain-containing protein [Burkholderiales bacterium]
MNKKVILAAAAAVLAGCATTTDLAKTLRYADNRPIGVENIRFVEMTEMKRGKACTWNIAYVVPVYGDGSIITAADDGKINTVQLIGETGKWYGPFSKNCTVVFGDKPVAPAPGTQAGS